MSILSELFNEEFSKVLNEQQINELTQPYSRTASAINRAKSTAKGFVGGGQYEQGAEQAGQLANRYFMNFKRYIGSKYGRKPQYVTFDDVKGFMDNNKLDSSSLGSNQNMTYTPKDVAGLFLKAAQDQVSSGMVPPSAQAGTGSQGSGTQPQPAPQGQGAPNTPPAPSNSGSGTPPASNTAGSGTPAPASSSTSGTLASLTPAQRTQLLAILSKI